MKFRIKLRGICLKALKLLTIISCTATLPVQFANAENGRGNTGPDYLPYLIYQPPAIPSFGAYVYGAVLINGQPVSGATIAMTHNGVGPITATTVIVPEIQPAYAIYMFGSAPGQIGATYGSIVNLTASYLDTKTGQFYSETKTIELRPTFQDLLPVWFVFGSNSPIEPPPATSTPEITPTVNLTTTTESRLLSAGGAHTCAMIKGLVKCWGLNEIGQLGDGKGWTSAPSSLPTGMSDVPVQSIGLTDVRSVASGERQSCALLHSGHIKCWGATAFVGTVVPTDVNGIENAIDLAAGSGFACALISTDHSVKCWGQNNYGMLGDGSNFPSPFPVTVIQEDGTPLKNVTRLSSGRYFTCAVVNEGTKCWGYQAKILPTQEVTSTNRATAHISPKSGVIDITTDFSFGGCVILITRQVKCWGSLTYPYTNIPTLTPNLQAKKVSAGVLFACALTTNSEVKCWGDRGYANTGQLGANVLVTTTQPTLVPGLPADITDISAGWHHACARTSVGKVYCWGDNHVGQLGSGSVPTVTMSVVNAYQLPANLKQISVGVQQTCGINTNNRLMCIGSNLRQDIDSTQFTQTIESPIEITGLGEISSTTASEYHTLDAFAPTYWSSGHRCVVKPDGTVWCWGGNGFGQLGDGTTLFRKTPTQVLGLANIKSVVAGGAHTCALTNLGGVKCWGANYVLGTGNVNASLVPTDVVGLSANVSALAAGAHHTCAILMNGVLKCWGVNGDSQSISGGMGAKGWLGVGSTENVITVPLTVTGLISGVSAVSAGYGSTCAVVNGAVQCWGTVASFAFSTTYTSPFTTPVSVNGLNSGIVDVKIGQPHTCALTNAGAVKCWGSYIGNGQMGFTGGPITVTGLTSNVVAIDSRYNHSCALLNNGSTKCWGYARYGELGDGRATISPLPVQVVGLQPAKWTYMLYLSGDNDLSSYLDNVSHQLDQLPRSDDVSVVVLYDGAGKEDSYLWTTKNGKEYREGFNRWKLIESDSNMGNPKTLQGFIEWAHANFPAEHYYLSIADHGRGTSGIGWDTQNGPMASADRLTPAEIRTALDDATLKGSWKLDIIHFDACLMAMIENAYQVKDYAHYMIASENLTFAFYPYDRYVNLAIQNPVIQPQDLATGIANQYYDYDYLRVNNAPRTISVLNLDKIGTVIAPLDALASQLPIQSSILTAARDAAQKFDASPTLTATGTLSSYVYLTITNDDEYVDLRDLAKQIALRSTGSVQVSAQVLVDALAQGISNFVVLSRTQSGIDKLVSGNEWKLDGANGVAIFFPRQRGAWGYDDYIGNTLFTFTSASSWSQLLPAYYDAINSQPIKPIDPGVPPVIRSTKPITNHCPTANATDVCIWGAIYSNTLPIANAQVSLTRANGVSIATTQTMWLSETHPIFALAVNPSLVGIGQLMTLTAEYGQTKLAQPLRLAPQNREMEVNITLNVSPVISEAGHPIPAPQVAISVAFVSPITITPSITQVTFYAQANSSDRSKIVEYKWKINTVSGSIDLGNSDTLILPASNLPSGTYSVSVIAIGESGSVSPEATRRITVWNRRFLPIVRRQ